MAIPQKKLKDDARKYLKLAELFPKSKIDLRSKLTKYQVTKINRSLAEIKMFGGDSLNQFVPMGKGRKKYMHDKGLPPWLGGIFLSGGEAVNKKLRYEKGEVKYERGGAPRSWTELDTGDDEHALLKSADKILKRRARRTAALTANGFVISSAQNLRANELIKKEAAYIFLKYSDMYDAGEMRTHKGHLQQAAHPNTWGMGILFEQGKSPIEKEKTRAKYSKAWQAKHKKGQA